MTVDRRDFLKVAGAHAGLLIANACTPASSRLTPSAQSPLGAPALAKGSPDVIVIGAGAFGGWTSHHLRRMGAKVLLVDSYGPGNSRSTSGDETRGVRTSYGDRPHGEQWMRWARIAIDRWKAFDEEWRREQGLAVYFTTGDLIMRADWEPFLKDTRALWDKVGISYEVVPPDEARYRYPAVDMTGINVVLHEPGAGVVRSRRSCEAVATAFQRAGGRLEVATASSLVTQGNRLTGIELSSGRRVQAGTYVFACGPWLGRIFSTLLGKRIRTPLGNVYYFGTPEGDERFIHPNLPSFNFPGITGWPALAVDNRGFRVRVGGGGSGDPQTSQRVIDPQLHDRARKFLADRFPAIAGMPIVETRSCHYELTVTRNFIVDRHPDMENVWIAGGGNAEGFKFGPVIGEYIAQRVLGTGADPALAEGFRISKEVFEDPAPIPSPVAAKPDEAE